MAEGIRSADGRWMCPKCGCADLRGEKNSEVESTWHPSTQAVTRRRRICRHCGKHVITTDEIEIPPGFKIAVVPEDDYENEKDAA